MLVSWARFSSIDIHNEIFLIQFFNLIKDAGTKASSTIRFFKRKLNSYGDVPAMRESVAAVAVQAGRIHEATGPEGGTS